MKEKKKCLNCNSEIHNSPKKRERMFCNNTCRTNYWQRSKRLESQGKPVDEIIKILSTSFATKRPPVVEINDLTNPNRIIKPTEIPKTNFSINAPMTKNKPQESNNEPVNASEGIVPPMPIKMEGENSFDYAARKNEWKKKYNK